MTEALQAAYAIDLAGVRRELEDGKGYLTRLFKSIAPQCEPMIELPLLATQIDNYIAGLQQQLSDALRERDLAIAHDRQPYPTAEAYEKVCKALEVTKQQLSAAQAEITALRTEREIKVAQWNDYWESERDQLQQEVARLKRGEYVCQKCGLRKDGEAPEVDF